MAAKTVAEGLTLYGGNPINLTRLNDKERMPMADSPEEHTTQGTCDVCREDSSRCEPLPGQNQDTVLVCENCRDFPYGEFMDAMASVE